VSVTLPANNICVIPQRYIGGMITQKQSKQINRNNETKASKRKGYVVHFSSLKKKIIQMHSKPSEIISADKNRKRRSSSS